MSKQRSSGPHRRILVRLCALALIAAMLLTSAYAGGAVESGPAVESLATENLAAENLAPQSAAPSEGAEASSTGHREQSMASDAAAAAPRATPDTVETEDTLSKGVHINLFDYDGSRANRLFNYNRRNWFTFTGSGAIDVNNDIGWNSYTQTNGGVYQGILQGELGEDGYPQLTTTYQSGRQTWTFNSNPSFSKLFNPDNAGLNYAMTTAYEDVNYLFQLDNDGYYYYDSEKNFASIKTDREENNYFNVYRVPYKENATAPSDPKFLPFNDLDDQRGNSLRGNANFHFGMTMDFQFLQPKNGKVTDRNNRQQDMVFEFRGDDDVWLFIDGILVLDMGGIHDAYEGSVNFADGEVYIEHVNGNEANNNQKIENLYNIMRRNGASYEYLRDNFEKNEKGQWIFKDYTTHTFNYYYLERGAGGSNCKIKFNLQSIPDDTIYVGKQITKANVPDFSDAKFDFLVEVKPLDKDGQPYGDYAPYSGSYKIYRGTPGAPDAELISEGSTTHGKFTLQHNQYAELPDKVKATTQYRVTELGAYSDQYEITSVDTVTKVYDDHGNVIGHRVDDLIVGEAPFALFENAIYAENANSLVITKEMAPGHSSDDEFTVAIKIGGEPYASGVYYGQTQGGGIDNENPKQADDQGYVKMRAGETIYIMPLPWGTTFEVDEVNLAPEYAEEAYAIEDAEKDSVSTDDGKAVGQIPLTVTASKQTTVTITNALKVASFTFTKVDADSNDTLLAGAKFELWPAGDDWVKDSNVDKPLYPTYQDNGESTGQDGNATFTDIPFGNYLLYEVKAPAGYKLPTDPVRVTVEVGMVTFYNVEGDKIDEIQLPSGGEGEDSTGEAATIPNKEQDELPVAGGMGAIWFSAGGLALASAAALLYFKQRKRGEE